MIESPSVNGHSFYLNVVVMDNGNVATPALTEEEEEQEEGQETAPEELQVESKKFDSKALFVSMGKSMSRNTAELGKSLSDSVHGINQRASAFRANKTMVSRAGIAVNEAIPEITTEIGLDISISKRFQQGPVIVIEVDIKGCNMATLIETTHGDEASLHYKNVKEGMEFLGATESEKSFDAEILPKVRKDLMKKLEVLMSDKMKKASYMEVQIIALEHHEEAKWLYNFLEFMQQMKKNPSL